MTEPNLDKDIDSILKECVDMCADSVICLDTDKHIEISDKRWLGRGPNGYYRNQIKALIAQEIRIATDRAFDKFNKATLIGEKKARIDELELAVKSFEWGKGTDYLTDRIAWVKRNTPDHWAIHGDELPSASLTRALIDEDIEKCEQHIAEMEEELKKRRPNQPTKANKGDDNE